MLIYGPARNDSGNQSISQTYWYRVEPVLTGILMEAGADINLVSAGTSDGVQNSLIALFHILPSNSGNRSYGTLIVNPLGAMASL